MIKFQYHDDADSVFPYALGIEVLLETDANITDIMEGLVAFLSALGFTDESISKGFETMSGEENNDTVDV